MNSIGGFIKFKTNIYSKNKKKEYYNNICLNYGRCCLFLILKSHNINKIFIPYYICDSVIDVINKLNIEYEFYQINESLEINKTINLNKNEKILAINYFGIKNHYIDTLNSNYIIDCTQAFFYKPKQIGFNSARKFFGVSDGAYLFDNKKYTINNHNKSNLYTAYDKYKNYEDNIQIQPKLCSHLTKQTLKHTDYSKIKLIRKRNFLYLHGKLSNLNLLNININNDTPLCYPLLLSSYIDKKVFYSKQIFIPTYWNHNHYNANFIFENLLTQNLIPLPIDHRITLSDCDYIIDIIKYNLTRK